MTCTIDGTTIDFLGRSSESDVAIVVTAGGSQILLGYESGSPSSSSGARARAVEGERNRHKAQRLVGHEPRSRKQKETR